MALACSKQTVRAHAACSPEGQGRPGGLRGAVVPWEQSLSKEDEENGENPGCWGGLDKDPKFIP